MSFLNKLFGNKGNKNLALILMSTRRDIFNIYGVIKPTDAQKMKASVYLCIAGIAILNDLGSAIVNDLGSERVHRLMDKLVEETKDLTEPLSMRVGELANSKEDLEEILTDFPKEHRLNELTTLNGLGAFEALYFTKVEKLMNDILNHRGGPLGAVGYASIIVADGIFGKGKSKGHFVEVSGRLLTFMEELGEAI